MALLIKDNSLDTALLFFYKRSMKLIYMLLVLPILLVGCNEEEVNALKEQNAELQGQLDELAAAHKAKAEGEAAALAKATKKHDKLSAENGNLTDQLKVATKKIAKLEAEDTAQKKAAEEAKSNQQGLLAEAVNYFKVKGRLEVSGSRTIQKYGENWTYKKDINHSDFKYDPVTKSLSFFTLETNKTEIRGRFSLEESGSVYMYQRRIFLETCNPLINIEDHKDVTYQIPNLVEVQIVGETQGKFVSKRGEFEVNPKASDEENLKNSLFEQLLFTKEEMNKFQAEEYSEKKVSTVSFILDAETAKTLKSVLTDLLKAHGVNPSKY